MTTIINIYLLIILQLFLKQNETYRNQISDLNLQNEEEKE